MATPVSPKITDHTTQAENRLPGFEQESIFIKALIRSVVGEVQPLEDVADDILNKRAISTAEGVQLDNIGTILNLTRTIGQSDASYAAALLGRASSISAGSGTAEQLIQTLLLLYGADGGDVTYADLGNASAELFIVVDDDGDPADSDVVATMNSAKAAGVRLAIAILDPAPFFLFGDDADADGNGDLDASANGFGDDADADGNGDISPGVGGGNFARLVT